VLANLIRNGLLFREPDPTHGRILRSSLTASGRRVLVEAHARVKEIEDIMIAAIGAKEAKRLAAVLSKCADRLADDQ
jgi:DNA-binding MarR family transcriptional regulator